MFKTTQTCEQQKKFDSQVSKVWFIFARNYGNFKITFLRTHADFMGDFCYFGSNEAHSPKVSNSLKNQVFLRKVK